MDDPGDNNFLERDFSSVPSATFEGFPLHTSNRLIVFLFFTVVQVPLVSCLVGGLGGEGFIS